MGWRVCSLHPTHRRRRLGTRVRSARLESHRSRNTLRAVQATYRTEGWGGDEISGVHNNPGEGGWKTRIRTGIGGQEKKAAYFRILKKANYIFRKDLAAFHAQAAWQRRKQRDTSRWNPVYQRYWLNSADGGAD